MRIDTPVLPQEPEIERIIIGAVLIREDLKLFETVRRELETGAFTVPFNREAILAMSALADRGDEINPMTLWKELEARGTAYKDTPVRIAEMTNGVPALSSLKTEIRRLKEVWTRREIMRCADAWLTEAQARDVDLPALVKSITGRAADFGQSVKVEAAPIEISWAQMCEMVFEQRETILHEVERGEIVRCSAITNRGKTTLWRNAALSLACGREFLPIVPCGPARRVLYLDFETRLRRLRPDITKMLGRFTVAERALVAENFHVVADCQIDGYPLTLTNARHLDIVEASARRIGADVIIIDTLSAAFGIDNENDNSEAAKIMKRLINLAQRLNCVIVFLDHIGKTKLEEGQTAQAVHRGRGASAYSGFSTAIFNLLPDGGNEHRVTLECAKVKGQRFSDTLMDLDAESRWFSSAGVSAPAPSVEARLLGIFNGHPLKRAEILKLLADVPRGTVDRYLKEACENGDLIKSDHGMFSSSHSYRNENLRTSPQTEENTIDNIDWGDEDENGRENFDDYPEMED